MTRRAFFRILAGIIVVVAVEATARGARAWIRARGGLITEPAYSGRLSDAQRTIIRTQILGDQMAYTDYSPSLGWTIRPHGTSTLYHANSRGIRATREFESYPGAGVVRIAAFGDSFTHGDDVADRDTWAARLESRLTRSEVLNFGVGGYGTDQALLRYEAEGSAFHPAIVLLGIRPENIYRLVSVFRPFYMPATGVPMTKPRFDLGPAGLRLIPNPIPSREGYRALLEAESSELDRIGRHDVYYRRSFHAARVDASATIELLRLAVHSVSIRWRTESVEQGGTFRPESEAFRILSAICARFKDQVREAGSIPIVVMLPDDDDVEAYLTDGVRRYDPLLSFLTAGSIEYLDAMDALAGYARAHEMSALFSGHYTVLGNSLVADYVAGELESRGHVSRARQQSAVPAGSGR